MINNDNHFKKLHRKNLVLPERKNINNHPEYKPENIEVQKNNGELKKHNIPNIEIDKPELESILDKTF